MKQGDRAMKIIIAVVALATLLASPVLAGTSSVSDSNNSGATGGGSAGYNWAVLHDA
jgi:opacity protein-like surface antigen